MPAVLKILQMNDSHNRKGIVEAIRAETDAVPISCMVSILDTGDGKTWDLVIKSSEGAEVGRTLRESEGELVPAVFRIRLRELIKLI